MAAFFAIRKESLGHKEKERRFSEIRIASLNGFVRLSFLCRFIKECFKTRPGTLLASLKLS